MFNFKSFLAVFLLCFSTFLFVSCDEQELNEVVSQQKETLGIQEYEDYTYEKIMYEGQEIIVKKIGDKYFSDDVGVVPDHVYLEQLRAEQIKNGKKGANEQPTIAGLGVGPTRTTQLWSGGIIVYEITQDIIDADALAGVSPNDSRYRVNRIREAIRILTLETNLTFRERTASDDYFIQFKAGSAASELIGRITTSGTGQYITLPVWVSLRTTIHEICHAAGLHHEQRRSDRDQYINVIDSNIAGYAKAQYATFVPSGTNYKYGTFDFQSIMLYSSFGGSVATDESRPTMTRKDNGATWQENQTLSAGDISAINTMYAGQTGGGTGNPPNNTVPNDVPTSHWAYNEILYMWQNNYILGNNGVSYRPGDNLTRAQFAAMIVSVINPSPTFNPGISFTDISTHWGKDVILQAARAGYLSGSNGLFRPNDNITKNEMTISLMNGLKRNYPNLMLTGSPSDISSFSDYSSILTWARESVQNAAKNRLIANHPNVNAFTPNRDASRAEAAMIFYQVLVKQNRALARSNPFLVIR